MSKVLSYLSPFGVGGNRAKCNDDDFVDRLHHTYTVMLLIAFSVVVSTKQYVGDPIHCWVPGHFTSNHEDYANHACWVSNTYYIPQDKRTIPVEGERREWINYYQWLPMILLTQACLFHLPILLWRRLSSKSGVQINALVGAGLGMDEPDKDRGKYIEYMAQQIHRYLGRYRESESHGCRRKLRCGKKSGSYLTPLYIFVKILNMVNCLGQLFLMDVFLGTDFHFYGFHALKALVSDKPWPGSSRFPVFTMCDYKVRQMGHNIHRHTVQCVLPINFFNEKLFLALWLWLLVICFITALNLLMWLARVIFPTDRFRYVRQHLRATRKDTDREFVKRFVQDYLRQDGAILLRLVQANTSDIVASTLVAEIFQLYGKDPSKYSKKISPRDTVGQLV